MGTQDKMIVDLAKALRAARSLLREEHYGVLDCACPKENGKPDVSRIDAGFRSLHRRYVRVLKQINSVLEN